MARQGCVCVCFLGVPLAHTHRDTHTHNAITSHTYNALVGHFCPYPHTPTQAQSAIIPAFDAFLGVAHEMDSMREYLLEMRRYMPRPHVAFIERLEALSPSVREQVLESSGSGDSGLVAAYNTALESLARFRCVYVCGAWCAVSRSDVRTSVLIYHRQRILNRARHLVYADRYIKRPAEQQQSHDGAGATDAVAEVGTGGSDFVPYLEKHHRETKAHYVAKPPR